MKNRRYLNSLFSHDRKAMYIVLGIVMISVLTLTVVYAALSTTLNINGQAEVSSASWDIHLDNVQLNSSSATTTAPSIINSTTATFTTTLSKPGDFYEFTIDVVNNGSIDAMIDGVTKTPTLTEAQAKYLNYIVEYQNGEAVTSKQIVSKNSYVRLLVKVEFRKDLTASDLPTASDTLDLAFTVNYTQADETGTNVKDNGAEKTLIEFTVGNVSYQAEKGMTWGEWIDSEYNTSGYFYGNNDWIFRDSDCYAYDVGVGWVTKIQIISAKHAYLITCNGGA